MQVVDCTLTVENSNFWHEFPRSMVYGGLNKPVRVDRKMGTVEEDGILSTEIETTSQSHTHVDVPAHWIEDGEALHEVEADRFIGDAALFDMSHKEAGEQVTREDLENVDVELNEDEIAIIRTDWTDEAWGTKRFWTDMITLSAEAGEWLMDHGIKGLAQDFYVGPHPVETCDHCGGLAPGLPEHPCHELFLGNGVILFEWCTNFGEISQDRVQFIGLPMKIKDADGGPTRIVVIED